MSTLNNKEVSNSDESDNSMTNNKISKDIAIVPKRRGRPKKIVEKKIIHKTKSKNASTYALEDELLLHIRLYDDDNNSVSEQNNIFTMKDDSEYDDKIKTFTHSEDDISTSDKSDLSIKKLLLEIKKKDAIIKKLKAGNSKFELNESISILPTESKIKKINLNLIDISSGKSIVVDKTSIACWWCTYNFDTIPCCIPDRYYCGKFYVFGCFCNFSCAIAYNLDMNDYRVPLRNALIKEMYTKMTGLTDNIPIAPKRELLKKFGGILSIEEFRNKLLLIKKEYKMNLPPTVPLILNIEEVESDFNSKKTLMKSIERSKSHF